jgi:hypothetical protein
MKKQILYAILLTTSFSILFLFLFKKILPAKQNPLALLGILIPSVPCFNLDVVLKGNNKETQLGFIKLSARSRHSEDNYPGNVHQKSPAKP